MSPASSSKMAEVVADKPRIGREVAISLAVRLAPQYGEILKDLHKREFQFVDRIAAVRDRFGSYVKLYENETHLGVALCMGLWGEAEFNEFNEKSRSWTREEQQAALEDFASEELDDADFALPETEQEWRALERETAAMTPEEREAAVRQSWFFLSGMFGSFFNTLSLMVHGVKLTILVPQALTGDDSALLKAVQIDRYLLTHHPYFRERKLKAQEEQFSSKAEREFLARLLYRERNAVLRGKVRYPALYMLFGILEACGWLNDMKHDEILDLCEKAELDRYQNRIYDVNAVTKRLREYRRWQKTCTVSMH